MLCCIKRRDEVVMCGSCGENLDGCFKVQKHAVWNECVAVCVQLSVCKTSKSFHFFHKKNIKKKPLALKLVLLCGVGEGISWVWLGADEGFRSKTSFQTHFTCNGLHRVVCQTRGMKEKPQGRAIFTGFNQDSPAKPYLRELSVSAAHL